MIAADLSSPNDTVTLASRLESTHYDVLINNAGFGLREKGVYVLAFSPSVMATRFHTAAGASAAVFSRTPAG